MADDLREGVKHGPYCALCGACKQCEKDTQCWSQDWTEDGQSTAVREPKHVWNVQPATT